MDKQRILKNGDDGGKQQQHNQSDARSSIIAKFNQNIQGNNQLVAYQNNIASSSGGNEHW